MGHELAQRVIKPVEQTQFSRVAKPAMSDMRVLVGSTAIALDPHRNAAKPFSRMCGLKAEATSIREP